MEGRVLFHSMVEAVVYRLVGLGTVASEVQVEVLEGLVALEVAATSPEEAEETSREKVTRQPQ